MPPPVYAARVIRTPAEPPLALQSAGRCRMEPEHPRGVSYDDDDDDLDDDPEDDDDEDDDEEDDDDEEVWQVSQYAG
jgi:hypothetical protein